MLAFTCVYLISFFVSKLLDISQCYSNNKCQLYICNFQCQNIKCVQTVQSWVLLTSGHKMRHDVSKQSPDWPEVSSPGL